MASGILGEVLSRAGVVLSASWTRLVMSLRVFVGTVREAFSAALEAAPFGPAKPRHVIERFCFRARLCRYQKYRGEHDGEGYHEVE